MTNGDKGLVMSSNNPYAKAAEKYRPNKTCVLFVAEAPPGSVDRHFYFEHVKRGDWLWIALMKAVYPSEWESTKVERRRKVYWLLKFQKSGFLLVDAVKTSRSLFAALTKKGWSHRITFPRAD